MCWRRFHFRDLLINALGRFGRIARARRKQEDTFPPPSSNNGSPSSRHSRITVANLTLVWHLCHKINKSITFPHTAMASTATRVEIASSHISVSLLNIPPSMPKLLGSTQVTIVSQCCGSELHVMVMLMRVNVEKKRHRHLINPMLRRKLFELWVFYTKQTWQTT